MKQLIIGVTGRKGVGKSTLASMLRDEIPGAEIVALADALKDDVAEMVATSAFVVPPIGRAWLDAHKGEVFGPLLQGWGALMRLAISPDYWIDVLEEEIAGLDAVIVPDVRYVNEAEFIHRSGGLLVAVDGPSRWPDDRRSTAHSSESEVDKVRQLADVVIVNDGSAVSLAAFARSFAQGALVVPV